MSADQLRATLRHRWRPIVSGIAVLLMLVLVVIALDRWASRSAAGQARLAATERMRANAGRFESELQKYRLLPLVLAGNSDVLLLVQSHQAKTARQLNLKLRSLAKDTGIAVIYVIDAEGKTLASSNFDLPESFVGENFAFRPYFREALAGRQSEYFAMGALSGRPGLFFAQRIADGDGVVVAKIAFEQLEMEWAKQPGMTLIRDLNGVVTVASNLNWVLRTTRPLSPDAYREAQLARQFGAQGPQALAFTLPPSNTALGATEALVELAPNRRFAIASTPVSIANWSLSALEPLEPALEDAQSRAQVIGLLTLLVVVVITGLLIRNREKRRLLMASRQRLEEEVKERTAELRDTNKQLVTEIAERERTNRRLREAQAELAQANRLGSIGQITAGVAHEINQPVAAIRTFAENAKIFIEKSELAQTGRNLDLIIDLTSNIGRITSELRSFARRDPLPIGTVKVGDALDGALILVGDRLRAENVTLTVPTKSVLAVTVVAERVRLGQVFVNLLQNSLDALTEVEDRRIDVRIDARADAEEILVTFDDSGSGIPAGVRKTLFKPFVTGKKNGLGLGLGIAQDIVREFGGELVLCKSRLDGSAFSITLLKS